jgi:hypothetical protein
MFGKVLRCWNDASESGWIRRIRAERFDARLANEHTELSQDTVGSNVTCEFRFGVVAI